MEQNTIGAIYDDIPNDIRLLIMSFCDLQTAIRCSGISKIWHKCSKDDHIWRRIYFNTFANFNPKPHDDVNDWKEEIKKKIKIYDFNFEQYEHLLGNVKINYKLNPPVELSGHLHKRLELRVNGDLLPDMGYFGPDDACYSDWIERVFEPLFRRFDKNINDHCWDFCDQNMPAFEFKKEGPICKLSIVEGCCGGGPDPRWQNREFLVEELRAEYLKFLKKLHEELITKYGKDGQEYWDELELKVKMD
eukprot:TRINITY_DN2460_c0_g1_i3.p1 TRINITY_DN2460_c0_g1~~TRINITY_DN2460_c0_g1_i3.p1  ORF type:complete len:247 (-),score=21.79 TRINITY_DN2460_c0_g1_i3:8-748(-)